MAVSLHPSFDHAESSQPPSAPEAIIKRVIDSGISEGHDQKVIGQLGDGAAVLATKILAGRVPTPTNIDMSLVVLRSAFADPSFVEATDREPRTALLLLRYLDLCTNDSTVKQRIAET